MTIFFDSHPFHYEVEGICKLFFPVSRFAHVYCAGDADFDAAEGDYAATVRREADGEIRLAARIRLGGKVSQAEDVLSPAEGENECERRLCALLYRLLCERTGMRPAWGILTGVRPVNIVQRELKAGKSPAEAGAMLRERFLVSEEKISLALSTARVQEALLKGIPPRSYSLYVAIPFCVSRCSYCSFVSHAITTKKATDKIDEYLEKLCLELEKTAQIARELSLRLDTVYIGGGTPTALSASQLKTVTDAVAAFFPLKEAREYTVEAGRADTITEEKLSVIRGAGADRISVNPQTFNDQVLRAVGRRHTAAQAVDAYLLARAQSFSAVNMDFIAGLPGDSGESFQATIDRALSLRPENITVHTLAIKRSADLFSEAGIAEYVKSGITDRMTAYAQRALTEAGYRPYYLYRQKNAVGNLENVGYSLPGKESLYNVYIMDEIQTILACGAGASTKLVGVAQDGKLPIQRIFNYKYHFEYIDRFDEILRRKERVTEFYGK